MYYGVNCPLSTVIMYMYTIHSDLYCSDALNFNFTSCIVSLSAHNFFFFFFLGGGGVPGKVEGGVFGNLGRFHLDN